MNGTVTYYYGRALTGQGEKQLYQELMEEAQEVIYIIGAIGSHASKLLRELGYLFIKQGEDVEWFYDPLQEDIVEALYIRVLGMLFIHDKEGVPRPRLLGSRHHVISFYECYDNRYLTLKGERLEELVQQGRIWREKLFAMLAIAKQLHDEWELVNQQGMDWKGLEVEQEYLERELFSTLHLHKEGKLTHRILGTLTQSGARNTVESITKGLERRVFIKGYPGTGKSSLMKKLAVSAIDRGFETQLIWCGLDATSIDMVVIPELNFCIFDSTEPHVYDPDERRPGDSILDLAQYCKLTGEQESRATEIALTYKEAMEQAKLIVQQYAKRIQEEREIFDEAINKSAWNEKRTELFLYA